MQNTRLTALFDGILRQFVQWLRNPWRRLSVLLVGLLLGNFFATVIATVTGQTADWDVIVAVILLLNCELISWLTYRRRSPRSGPAVSQPPFPPPIPMAASSPQPSSVAPLALDIANAVRIGFVYGLFVEALKLGS